MTNADPPVTETLPDPTLEEVSPGVFAYVQLDGSWCLNNPAFVVGASGVTAIDACATERRSRAFKAAIARTTDRGVSTLINTHAHLDHTFGNGVFTPQAVVVGHTRCREEILAGAETVRQTAHQMFPSVDWGEIEIEAPTLTFDDRLSLYVDDLELQLIYASPAHTTTDVIVWLPERRVLIAGDLIFNQGTPFALQGSISGWLVALETLRRLNPTTIIPGHGPVGGPELIDQVADYLRFVQRIAQPGFEAGATPLAVARDADLGPFAALHDSERLAGNLHRAYAELRHEPPGAPIDAAAAFQDMLALNGGQPLRCLA